MPLALTDRQRLKVACALRRGALDSFRIADALDRAGRTHFLIEVLDMGQFAKDWDQLKTIIRQKDDALDAQAAQLDAQARQIAALQKAAAAAPALDADDQGALAQLHQAALDNAPGPLPAKPNPPPAQPNSPPASPNSPSPIAAVTTFTK